MLGFVTQNINSPWTDNDVNYYKRYGSQRDRVIYNSKLNARFTLESTQGTYLYSCAIKLPYGEYRNFTIAPITFNNFFIVIYVPELSALHNMGRNKVIDKILPKFSLLELSVKSATMTDGIDLSKSCKIMGNCIWYEVNAPINQLLFPRNDDITNDVILDSYKRMCIIYEQIQNQIECFIKSCSEAYEKIRVKYSYEIERQNRIRNERIKKFLVRKGARILISSAIAAATGGLLVDIGGVCDAFVDIVELSELNELCDLGDFIANLDLDYSDMSEIYVPDYEFQDVDYIDIDDYELSEYNDLESSNNVSFQGNKDPSEVEDKLRNAKKNIEYYSDELKRTNITDVYRKKCTDRLVDAESKAEKLAKELKKILEKNN